MLSLTIRAQRFQTIAWRHTKVVQYLRLIQKTQFSQSGVLNIRRQFSTAPSGPDQLRLRIDEALDHDQL